MCVRPAGLTLGKVRSQTGHRNDVDPHESWGSENWGIDATHYVEISPIGKWDSPTCVFVRWNVHLNFWRDASVWTWHTAQYICICGREWHFWRDPRIRAHRLGELRKQQISENEAFIKVSLMLNNHSKYRVSIFSQNFCIIWFNLIHIIQTNLCKMIAIIVFPII